MLCQLWDLRMYTQLFCFKLDNPATCLDISATGLIAMGTGRSVQVLKDAYTKPSEALYLTHSVRTPNAALSAGGGAAARAKALLSDVQVASVKFRPFEDCLAIGHSHGLTSIIVPGAGEPNLDSFEANPFVNQKQRREEEIQGLLNKLSHDMIGLGAYTLHVCALLTLLRAMINNDIMSLTCMRTTSTEPFVCFTCLL